MTSQKQPSYARSIQDKLCSLQRGSMKHNATTFLFIGTIIILIIIGFIFIYSSSSVFALEKYDSSHYFVKKQLFGFMLGLIGLMISSIIPLRIIQHGSSLFFFFFLNDNRLHTVALGNYYSWLTPLADDIISRISTKRTS